MKSRVRCDGRDPYDSLLRVLEPSDLLDVIHKARPSPPWQKAWKVRRIGEGPIGGEDDRQPVPRQQKETLMFYQMKSRSSGPDTCHPGKRWQLYALAFLGLAILVVWVILLSYARKS